MQTSTRNEPDDPRSIKPAARSSAVEGKAKTAIRCRLCRETIVLETNFRPTAATCPHCGLKFVFDPEQEPLPVRGLRLRYSEVIEAQRRRGTVQFKRHDAHVRPATEPLPSKPNYLAWTGGLALSAAAAFAIFGGWLQRLWVR